MLCDVQSMCQVYMCQLNTHLATVLHSLFSTHVLWIQDFFYVHIFLVPSIIQLLRINLFYQVNCNILRVQGFTNNLNDFQLPEGTITLTFVV